MEARSREIKLYVAENGRSPFKDWLAALRDQSAKSRIDARLARLRLGSFGDVNQVGEGVIELKLDFGPGYRVYCAPDGDTIVVLLCGGIKKGQQTDIERARDYWRDYKS